MTNSLPTVKLRALEPEDLEFFYSIENDPELWDVSDYTTPYSRYVPVSYTHLDVYKRQLLKKACPKPYWRSTCISREIISSGQSFSLGDRK